MTRTDSGSGAAEWVDVSFDGHTLKLLNVSAVARRPRSCPEIVLLQVPDSAKKKLESGNELLNLLNTNTVFNPPATSMAHSESPPGSSKVWHLIVLHSRTCTGTAVWIPVAD
jgi:hypothetical protein